MNSVKLRAVAAVLVLLICNGIATAQSMPGGGGTSGASGAFGATSIGPCLTSAGSVLNTTNFISQTISGTTSTATITGSDSCGTVYITSSSAVSISSGSAASAGLTSGFVVTIENHSSATDTWTPTGSTVNGASSFPIGANTGCTFWSDGTAFQLLRSQCSSLPITSGNLPSNVTYRIAGLTIDGGGTAPGTGVKGYIRVPYSGTMTGYSIQADVSGSAVIDVWKANNAIPTITNTITASALPTLSSQQYVYSTMLTGWTTSVAAGDVLAFNLNSATTVTRVTLEIYITTN